MKKLLLALLCAASVFAMSSCSNARRVARNVAEFISYDITFDVGKATLKPESDKEIARIVALMIDDPSLCYEVQGHTDNTGSAASNLKLSQKRAQAVVDRMVKLGVPKDRLTAVGKGQEEPIANLHPAIKGVQGGNTSGTNIVGFNLPAFCSFGKKQGENAPIGESTAFAYTTALNTLLAKDSTNKLLVGEATAVFWCEKQTAFEEQFVALFAVEPKDNPDQGVEAVKALYSSANAGTMTPQDEKEKDLRFYVLGLSPNAARLAIRFWINSTIDEMKRSIVQHFEDIKINRPAYIERDFLPLFRLLVSVAVQGDAKNIPPNIEGDLMSAILEGKTYPRTLFNCAIERIRAERDITWPRAAILKAYLNRKLRLSKNADNNLDNTNNQTQPLTETEIQMSLDIENKNVGYCLGRLFATLEKIQDEANPGINATIRDRFYGAASGTPVTVFPNLIRLMTHHLSKLDNPGRVIYFEKLIGEILDKIDDFPATLSMEDQGRFALGYYHQNNDFYTKKTDSDNTQKTDSAKEEQSK